MEPAQHLNKDLQEKAMLEEAKKLKELKPLSEHTVQIIQMLNESFQSVRKEAVELLMKLIKEEAAALATHAEALVDLLEHKNADV